MSDQYTYARFWRCALQVNPVGYNSAYRGNEHGMSEADYNQALLAKCQELDIKVVGLADHGSVDSVDALRNVLTPYGIVVFPGFEIASTEKIHMVCLFPEGTTKDQLNRYLGSLHLTDPEEKVRPSTLGCIQLAETIKQLGGFWYAAHATQASGILVQKSLHTWQRSDLVKAAQIPGSVDDLPPEFKNIVLNTDPNWKRERPIAVINAKDVAKPSDLDDASASCWIKMTKPTFDAFKVAFLDPESRIRLNSQKPEVTAGEIVSMAISGGYLDGVEIAFSRHLNTVIGGRGTGKSTLLECLRYVLDIPPKGKQAHKLHLEIIKENLGRASGRIEVEVVSSSQHGKRYRVSRRYGEMPIVREVVPDGSGNVSTLQPRDLLPGIDIYGQNEIYELAQDEQSRIQLLDRFLPGDGDYAQKNAVLKKRLQENQQKLVKTLGEVDDLKAQIARLPKLVEQLQGFQALGIQEKLAKTPLFARERQIVERTHDEIRRLQDSVVSLRDNMPDLTFISDKALEDLPNAALLSPVRTILDRLREGFERHWIELTTELANGEQQLAAQLVLWTQSITQGEQELEKALRSLPSTAGKSGPEVGTAYQRLLQDIERIKPLETRVANHDKLLESQQQERRNLLAELSDLRGQRTRSLQGAAKKLNRRLEGKLKVEVVPGADRTPLKNFLLDSKLEGIGEKRLSWIDERDVISPSALAQAIRSGSAALQVDWGLTPLVADALTKLPASRLMELEALELDHRVDISLNVSHGQVPAVFRPLDKLSTGQQCTAILHMLLLENVDPLIMDQPEDNLDNAFIADRIVHELRAAKISRQFLFATHNANIPVFGDAEWIGVFTAVENHGALSFDAQGSIDVPVIRDQVANILEGGRDAFIQRKEKYEF
ncbi:ABC-type lipoprotein export system ATPase subunit [Paraburkholderia tropica]|uniref:TrlF family AAA-like ATPase n=1 Tax=Paraburkholderia tropica TaxID=92647 RepID=UPI00161EF955|nr:AAA family ATPase [Paraburkholderia tropica]MBB3003743.1 ABC-type lipoprotein export system ATPase subunit [Paraburkholderia tropica]